MFVAKNTRTNTKHILYTHTQIQKHELGLLYVLLILFSLCPLSFFGINTSKRRKLLIKPNENKQ